MSKRFERHAERVRRELLGWDEAVVAEGEGILDENPLSLLMGMFLTTIPFGLLLLLLIQSGRRRMIFLTAERLVWAKLNVGGALSHVASVPLSELAVTYASPRSGRVRMVVGGKRKMFDFESSYAHVGRAIADAAAAVRA